MHAMNLALSAVVVYTLVAAYLFIRGAGFSRIAKVLALGLGAGLVMSYTLGLMYYLIVLQKPVQTISVFSMLMLPFAAILVAREEILGTITPLGIILLNVAANAADRVSSVPLSFAWLLPYVPIPYGPVRLPIDLFIMYLPSWAALWMLHRGPPGRPLLRYLLGAWVCVVSALSIVGLGWKAISGLRLDEPSALLASAFAVYAAVHALLLALNLFASVGGGSEDEGAARSIARSVRVDRMPVGRAFAIGLAFWAVAFAWMRTPLSPELKASVVLGVGLALGPLLAGKPGERPAGADEVAPRGYSLGTAALLAVAAGLALVIGLWAWRDLNAQAARQTASAQPSNEFILQYHEPALQDLLKRRLDEAGVPFRVDMYRGREFLRVANEYRERANAVSAQIDGPPLPKSGGMQFSSPGRQAAYSAWLDRKGVKWEVVTKQLKEYFVVEEAPGHEFLYTAFNESENDRLGVDYYAIYVVARRPGVDLDLQRIAVFAFPQQRDAFESWLRGKGIGPRRVTREKVEFVTWQSAEPGLLAEYRRTH